MKISKKILGIVLALSVALLLVGTAYAQFSGGFSMPNYWKLGDYGYGYGSLNPAGDWDLGYPGGEIANIYAENFEVETLTIDYGVENLGLELRYGFEGTPDADDDMYVDFNRGAESDTRILWDEGIDELSLINSGTAGLTIDSSGNVSSSQTIAGNQLQSTVASGTAPLVVASNTAVSNLNSDLLDDQEGSYYLDSGNFTGTNWTDLTDAGETALHIHDDRYYTEGEIDTSLGDYLKKDGTVALTSDWDAGSYEVRAQTLESDVATGTAPMTIASTTKVSNLNSDLLDDQSGSYYLDSANFTGTDWTDLTDGNGTTLHNHDSRYYTESETNTLLGNYINKDGTVGLTANWDAGSYEIRAQTLESDVATGTAPMTIASTTTVTNLSCDLWDGYQFSDYLDQAVKQASSPTFGGMTVNGSISVTGNVDGVDVAALKSDVDGFPDELKNLATAEIQQMENIGSTTVSAAQWGYLGAMNQGVATSNSPTFVGVTTGALTASSNLDIGSYEMRAQTFKSDVTTGTAPMTVASTTVVSNLNADKVDGLDSSSLVQTSGNQTVAGTKTFSSFPVTPSSAPTTDYQAANKKYVDDSVAGAGGGGKASTHTRSTGAGTGTQALAHGLGSTPSYVRITAVQNLGNPQITYSVGAATGTSDEVAQVYAFDAGQANVEQISGSIIAMEDSGSTDRGRAEISSLDATNVTINWTTACSSATCNLLLEVW